MSSSNWDPPSYTEHDVDDFVIPDEEVPAPKKAPAASGALPAANAQANGGPTSGAGDFFSLPWNTRVDLSSTFTPFAATAGNATVREHQYTGGDTLDETVWETLKRDLLRIWKRLTLVVWPAQLAQLAAQQQARLVDFATANGVALPSAIVQNRRVDVSQDPEDAIESPHSLHSSLDWDMWGPLIFSLLYSVTLGMSASSKQTNSVFSGSFSFIWFFFLAIGLNIQLLGGNISFMSAISAVGYSLFPIAVGELVCSLILKWKLIRIVLMAVLWLWSVYAAVMSLKVSGVLPGRVVLAMYPVGLMYAGLSWLSIIT